MNASQLLQKAGLRNTRTRRVILEFLQEVKHPLSHQEIALHLDDRAIDRVTLYRTLATLEESGLLHRIRGIDGTWRFSGQRAESDRCAGNHIHFLCTVCDQMNCLPEQPLPWVQPPVGARVLGKQLIVYGVCDQCIRRKDSV